MDSNYCIVVVGSPDRQYLWNLARIPTLEEPVYQELVSFRQQFGFQTDRLVRAAPTALESVRSPDLNVDNPALGRKTE